MTLQSYAKSNEETASNSSSTVITSTDIYPSPYEGEHKIFLNDDESAVVNHAVENDFLGGNVAISVEKSSHTHIGHKTIINRPVTVIRGEVEKGHYKCKCFTFMIFILASLLIILYKLHSSLSNTGAVTNSSSNNITVVKEIFIKRSVWGAKNPKYVKHVQNFALFVIIKHTGGSSCSMLENCSAIVRDIQNNHMNILNLSDISYNFLIGGDGRVYEGRGWDVKNEGMEGSVDIAFIGNFSEEYPTESMLYMGKEIIAQGHGFGFIDYPGYVVLNHNQTEKTDSPGTHLFNQIVNYERYTSTIFYDV